MCYVRVDDKDETAFRKTLEQYYVEFSRRYDEKTCVWVFYLRQQLHPSRENNERRAARFFLAIMMVLGVVSIFAGKAWLVGAFFMILFGALAMSSELTANKIKKALKHDGE